ncbi:MAG TPA: hypothetical protein VK174_15970 [Chitinophagales bacterium]|nr:hypothetical protein [Chitinophagales bacterium]
MFHLLGIDDIADMALTLGIGMGVISIATVFTRRRYVSTGYLELTSEQIVIERKEDKQKYDLRELTIWITRSPYYAGDIEGGPRNYFFGDNWLEFDWKGNRQRFEFAIDSHYKSNQLLKLLDLWKAKGVDYYFKQQPDFFRRGDD